MADDGATRVYVVRHGNTFDKGDVILRVGGRTDLPLSTSGQAQAEALATHFAEAGVQFDRAFSSELKRTQATAAAILRAQAGAPEIKPAAFLREIDYGPDEGRPEEEVVARIGQEALDAWERDATPPPAWLVDPSKMIAEWARFLDEAAQSDSKAILAATSNGVARFLLDVPGLEKGDAPLKLRTGAYGIVRLGAGRPVLEGWNIRP